MAVRPTPAGMSGFGLLTRCTLGHSCGSTWWTATNGAYQLLDRADTAPTGIPGEVVQPGQQAGADADENGAPPA
ncbi:hypothetical protein ACH4RA_02495 [Streptomyces smyrnaeus]|uniref:hypothetical protein n=1 Tax=Streptomyces TaxID=1883 RepID=UPI000C3CD65C|nr:MULTISPECIES: hypothetical protein [unclassified Streptomyces]MBQ0862260.1 hypothetical protein [Streptomyces sp. RK75]MBQ1125226.1 hypothetical protein [Streptomyces sp. B15]MBQ1162299.1 hypothetical protein [Streptomyces sp. A73]